MVQFVEDCYISDDIAVRRAQIVEVVLSHCAHVLWPKQPEKLRKAAEWAEGVRSAIHQRRTAVRAAMTPMGSMTSPESEQLGVNSFDSEGGGGGSGSGSGGMVPPAKKGANGLSVASADVILCKEPPRHRSERRHNRGDKTAVATDESTSQQEGTGLGAGGHASPTASVNGLATPVSSAHAHDQQTSFSRSPPGICSTTATATASASHLAHDNSTSAAATSEANNPLPSSLPQQPPLAPDAPCAEGEGGSGGGGDDGDPPEVVPDCYYMYRDGVAATMPDGGVVFVSSTGSPLKDLNRELPHLPRVPLHVKRLSGGITNELYHVYDEEDPDTSVVVRVYGKETERVISRESELFYQSLFLHTYVRGQNFLIYEFLAHHETLPYTEMAKEALPIARVVANFQVRATLAARHDRAPPLLREDGPPQSSPSQIPRAPPESDASTPRPPRFERETNYTVHSLTTWVDQITSAEILAKVHSDKRDDFAGVAQQLRAESEAMLRILEKEKDNLGESVCHNDLLSANFMRHESTGALKIIDFDYTKRDYFLFDAANHFNEYTGLECDYAQYFPSDAHMSKFIAEYRAAMREELAAAHKAEAVSAEEEIIPREWELFWGGGVATCPRGVYTVDGVVADKEADAVARWTALVKLLTLCSHLSWSIWSLVQEAVSQLDVDFLEYAKLRFARYRDTKEEYTVGLGFRADP